MTEDKAASSPHPGLVTVSIDEHQRMTIQSLQIERLLDLCDRHDRNGYVGVTTAEIRAVLGVTAAEHGWD